MKKAVNIQHGCQAKGCIKIGKWRQIAKWDYFICDEHNHLLIYDHRVYIARSLGIARALAWNFKLTLYRFASSIILPPQISAPFEQFGARASNDGEPR
jgi:hypothetical protein